MVHSAQNQYYARFTSFLDERQQALAESVLKKVHFSSYVLYGGADDCERLMLGVFPPDDEVDHSLFPIVPLAVRATSKETFSHRDCLGSLMGLGLKREALGDIWINGSIAILFLTEEVAEFVRMQLFRVGRVPVTVDNPKPEELQRTIRFEEKSGTVASLRLDCVVAFAVGKSRTQASTLIAGGLVSVNRVPTLSASKQLAPGDQIVIRGFGKCYLGEETRETKKGRLSITIKKLV